MKNRKNIQFELLALFCAGTVLGQDEKKSGYAPVVPQEAFSATMSCMKTEKSTVMKRQKDLLQERYDLKSDPAPDISMTRGKPVQRGIRLKLTAGMSREKLAAMTPETIRDGDLFPQGFLPLPHPNHPEGGTVFPQFEIDEIKK
jgi:cytochrome c peroxidase